MAGHHINRKSERLQIRLEPDTADLLRKVIEADPRFTASRYVRSLIAQCARFDLAELSRGGKCIRSSDTWVRETPSDSERLQEMEAEVEARIGQAGRAAPERD